MDENTKDENEQAGQEAPDTGALERVVADSDATVEVSDEAAAATAAPATDASATANKPEQKNADKASDASGDASTDEKAKAPKKPKSKRTMAIVLVIVIIVVAAIAGTAVYFMNRVPDGSAAKVNNTYISETEVSDYISTYRSRMQLTDDSAYASMLSQSGLSVETFRQQVIDQIAITKLIDQKAAELGVTPSSSDIQSQVDTLKQSVAMGDDSVWSQTLQTYGLTEDSIYNQAKTNLAEQAVYKKEVPTPTDAQTRSYMEKNKAGKTIRHSYRITFTGDDRVKNYKECYARLQKAKSTMTADIFSGFAMTYSSDSNVKSDGGAHGWSDATDIDSEYLAALKKLKQGEFSKPVSIGNDEYDIIYCDAVYIFPSKAKIKTMKLSNLPSSLKSYMSDSEATVLWDADCDTYLSNMLKDAQITYYPMPSDASYNVDTSSSSGSSSSSSSGSSSSSSSLSGSGSSSSSSSSK